jgi:hypothetical protein
MQADGDGGGENGVGGGGDVVRVMKHCSRPLMS